MAKIDFQAFVDKEIIDELAALRAENERLNTDNNKLRATLEYF